MIIGIIFEKSMQFFQCVRWSPNGKKERLYRSLEGSAYILIDWISLLINQYWSNLILELGRSRLNCVLLHFLTVFPFAKIKLIQISDHWWIQSIQSDPMRLEVTSMLISDDERTNLRFDCRNIGFCSEWSFKGLFNVHMKDRCIRETSSIPFIDLSIAPLSRSTCVVYLFSIPLLRFTLLYIRTYSY